MAGGKKGHADNAVVKLAGEVGPLECLAGAVIKRAVDDLAAGQSRDAQEFLLDWRGEAWCRCAGLDVETVRAMAGLDSWPEFAEYRVKGLAHCKAVC
jgi:hypothetical protein